MGFKKIIIGLLLFTFASELNAQSVGLVLSGGGAKGLSHIGLIKALEENNIPIDYICGTSMGAIIGGLYASGMTPNQMIELFSSKEFDSWFKGEPEAEYSSHFYKDDTSPQMFKFSFSFKLPQYPISDSFGKIISKKQLRMDLPLSLVPAFPMDLEFLHLFASASKAANNDFKNLMVPFFCVSSDIANKKEFISKSGDLSAAVRASMTYPFYFRPITIDSVLLFDGGFYNNFPWEIMEKEYNPNFIIGSKCVVENVKLDEEDVVTQVTGMMVVQTDYNIPPDKGIIIARQYPYGVMEFSKAREIAEMGYKNALPYIAVIKNKVTRERTQAQIDSLRQNFMAKCKPIRFKESINISNNMDNGEKSFISRTIRNDKEGTFSFDTFKRGYYRVIATNTVKTFYPSAELDSDTLSTLKLKVTKASPFSIAIGGNISSSSLNQGYLGLEYKSLGLKPWRVSGDLNIGKFYKGGGLKIRQDIGIRPLTFYSVDLVAHQFDYYGGNQDLFTPDKLPNNIQERELYLKLSLASAVSLKKNIVAKFSIGAARLSYRYFYNEVYNAKDDPNRTNIDIIYPELSFERNSQNYSIYATEGWKGFLGIRFIYGKENFKPGSRHPMSDLGAIDTENKASHRSIYCRFFTESYYRIAKWFHLGYLVDLTFSSTRGGVDYTTAMLYMPAFQPIPHSSSLMMESYRANTYAGAAVSPILFFTKTLFLHTTFSYFQPLEQIVNLGSGKYEYTQLFPQGGFIGNAALVWQSPIGPVSLSASYYAKGDYKQWYPQLNIGFLLFKKRALY